MPPLASPPCSTPQQAFAFVAAHGIVLVSARGSVPCLTEAIAGAPIKGSWWGHPAGKQIFAILEQVVDSGQVLVCRLIDGKLTLVHRRLWPLLACVAEQLAPEQISQITQQHTATGRHIKHACAFPDWMPAALLAEGAHASLDQARAVFGAWLQRS
jgi:hypothetical protein